MIRRLEELFALMRAASTLQELSGHIMDRVPSLFGAPVACFLLLNNRGTPRSIEFSGADAQLAQRYWQRAAPHDDVRKYVLSTGRPVHDLMIRTDFEWRQHPMYLEFGAQENLRHYGASPIVVGNSVAGVVGFGRADGAEALDSGDLLDLTAIALHAQARCGQLDGRPPRGVFDRMTPRQLEICRHVSVGLSNQEIARELHITSDGVKAHLKRIFALLGVESRDALAAEFSFWFSTPE
jgi:DNA-binding CsgD family transcriptional regulator